MKSEFALEVRYQICMLLMDGTLLIAIRLSWVKNIQAAANSIKNISQPGRSEADDSAFDALIEEVSANESHMYGTLLKFKMHIQIMEVLYFHVTSSLMG